MNQLGKDSWPGLKTVEIEPLGKAIVRDPHQFSLFAPYYSNVVNLIKETRTGGVNNYIQANLESRNSVLNKIDRFFEDIDEKEPMAGIALQSEFKRLSKNLSQEAIDKSYDDLLAKSLGIVAFPATTTYQKPENLSLAIVLENIKRRIVKELLPNITDKQAEEALGYGYTAKVVKSSAGEAWFKED